MHSDSKYNLESEAVSSLVSGLAECTRSILRSQTTSTNCRSGWPMDPDTNHPGASGASAVSCVAESLPELLRLAACAVLLLLPFGNLAILLLAIHVHSHN